MLLRIMEQTEAIDMWAVGVILLSLITRQFPFFASADDLDAVAEIAHLTGMDELNALAKQGGKKFLCSPKHCAARKKLKAKRNDK